MRCQYCSGEVTWRGPLSDLTHTQCDGCGRQNCQEVEPLPDDAEVEEEWEHPCPMRNYPRCDCGADYENAARGVKGDDRG